MIRLKESHLKQIKNLYKKVMVVGIFTLFFPPLVRKYGPSGPVMQTGREIRARSMQRSEPGQGGLDERKGGRTWSYSLVGQELVRILIGKYSVLKGLSEII